MHNATSNRRKTLVQVIAFTLSLATVNVVRAHDIWLHAERFSLGKGDTLIVHQLLGAELGADLLGPENTLELPVLRDMTPRFALLTPQGPVDLLRELPDIRTQPVVKPILTRKLDFDGLALVTMEHAIIYTEFDNDVFVEYLQHEGFDREEYRQEMGHAWLGFSRQQIERYLLQAGLESVRFHPLPPDPSARGPNLFAVTATSASGNSTNT